MQEKTRGGLFGRLSKTRENLSADLSSLFKHGVKLDDALYDKIKDQLIMADIGAELAFQITDALRRHAESEKLQSADALQESLAEQTSEVLQPVEQSLDTIAHASSSW